MGSSKYLKERMKAEPDVWLKFIINTFETRKEASDGEVEQLKHHWKQDWCLNKTPGGNSWHSQKFTLEHRAKLSAAGKKRKLTPEHIAKLVESHKGKTPSEETRAKLSAASSNASEETRAKLSAANKGRKRSTETKEKLSDATKNRTTFNIDGLIAASKGKRTPEQIQRRKETYWRNKALKETTKIA